MIKFNKKWQKVAIGSAVAIGSLAVLVKSPIEKKLESHQQEEAVARLATIKPVTFNAIALETKTLPEGEKAIDWSRIKPKSDIMKNAMKALENGDDALFKEADYSFIYPPSLLYRGRDIPNHMYESGEKTDVPDENKELVAEFDSIIQDQPEILVKVGEVLERQGQGALMAAYFRYEEGMAKGVSTAMKKYVALSEKNNGYGQVVELYGGKILDDQPFQVKDLFKAAEYFGTVAAKSPMIFRDNAAVSIVLNNGPAVAAKASKALLYGKSADKTSTPEEQRLACNKAGADIVDPLNQGQGIYENEKSGLDECLTAVISNPNDARTWYQLGYALGRNDEWNKAQIAYARAAELGSAAAIGRFWWIDSFADAKRAISMLEKEASSNNPWGDYFIGMIYSGNRKELANEAKAKEHFSKAYDSGIKLAGLSLANMLQKNGDTKGYITWVEKAAPYSPRLMIHTATIYLDGERVKPDYNEARRWLQRGKAAGEMRTERLLALLGNTEDDNILGQWQCESHNPNGKTSEEKWTFYYDESFSAITSPQESFSGFYSRFSPKISVSVTQTRQGNTSFTTNVALDLVETKLTESRLSFDSVMQRSGNRRTSDCKRVEEKWSPPQKPVVQEESQQSTDRVVAYANDLATQMEAASHPACQALAGTIRSFANSGAPDDVRMRQVEAIVNKAPSICFR